MRQLRALIRYRLQQLANRSRDGRRGVRVLLALAGVAMIIAAGAVMSPDHIGPMRVRGGVTHYGGWPLETAFYLGCLIAAVQSYRIMESFFRHREARILAVFPLRLRQLYLYRLGAALLDTGLLAAGAVLFLLPVWFKGGGLYFFWSAVLLLLTVLLVVAVGFATQMIAGVINTEHMPNVFAEIDRHAGGTGGGASIYLFSPAVALAVTLFLLLFSKLSLEEIIKDSLPHQTGSTGIIRIFVLVIAVVVIGCLVWAYRNFVRQYPVLFARFFESDLVVVDVGFDYFAADRRPARGLEARLSGRVRSIYRLYRLQLARSSPLAKILVIIGPIVAAILFLASRERFVPWLVMAIGCFWLTVLNNPWSRLYHPDMDPGMGALLPVPRRTRRRARSILLVREVLVLTVPLALVGLLLWDGEAILALALVPILGVAANPLLMALAERSWMAPRGLGFFVTVLFAALAALGPIGPSLGVLLVIVAAFAFRRVSIQLALTG